MREATSAWSDRVRAAARLLISAGLLYLLLRQVDWRAFAALWPRLQWRWLLLALALQALGFWLSARRWQVVLQDLGLHEPLSRLLYWNLLSFFWKHFLPTTVGGDGYRFWRAQARHPERRAAVFTSIFLDRLYGYLALLGVHFVLLGGVGKTILARQRGLALLEGLIGAGAAVLGVLVALWRGRRLVQNPRVPPWLRPWLARGQGVVDLIWGRSRSAWTRALAYSALFVLTNGTMLWAYLRVAGARPPWLPVAYASTLAAVLGALPVTINGLGLTEGALVVALTPIGLTREQVLLAAFLLRGVNLLIGLAGGLLYGLEGLLPREQRP
ncbi:MAG: flippase-like domain-containing protein [Chloroflexi bacterium]|nr:flippase-like domain-containing protein [Chloroflexota bacterium]